MKLIAIAISSVAALLLCGCAVETDWSQAGLVPFEGARREVAADFASQVATALDTAVVLGPREVEIYLLRPRELADRCRILGVRTVYLTLDDPEKLKKGSGSAASMTAFVRGLAESGIQSGLWITETELRCTPYSIYTGGPLFRRLSDPYERAGAFAAGINELNRLLASPPSAVPPVAEIVVELECRKFTAAARRRPPRMLDAWSETGYGLEGPDSRIFSESVDFATAFAAKLSGVKTAVAVEEYILSKGYEGLLAGATAPQLLQAFSRVVVIGNSGSPGMLANAQLNHICDPAVMPGVVLSQHSSDLSGLRRRTWEDLVNSLAFMAGKWRAAGAVSMVIMPFSRLETLLEQIPFGGEDGI